MTAILLDALNMVETLQAAGFSDQQARAVTTALSDSATVAQVATRGDAMDLGIGMKHDFDAVRAEIRAGFEAFKIEIRHDFELFKTEIRRDLGALKQRMSIELGTRMLAMTGVLFAALHFFHQPPHPRVPAVSLQRRKPSRAFRPTAGRHR